MAVLIELALQYGTSKGVCLKDEVTGCTPIRPIVKLDLLYDPLLRNMVRPGKPDMSDVDVDPQKDHVRDA